MKNNKIKYISVLLAVMYILNMFFITNINAAGLPSKYVTESKTPVLNQKNNPLCWAYCGSDMLSINAIKNGYAKNNTTVFSAPMMARAEFDGNEHRHSHGSVWYKCYGGIDYALMAGFSGKGLLYNSDYPTVDAADKAPVSALYSGDSYIDNFRVLDTSEMDKKQRTEAIKELIYEFGSVSADAFIGNYNSVTKIANLQKYDNSKVPHSILLVGWDDTKYTDIGTGAFLMKNTWGESWGDGGYAWVAYNSEFGRSMYAASVVKDEDIRILTHVETVFASGNNADAKNEYGAVNVFDIKEKMTLTQAGVYTNKTSSDITVKVYINLSDPSDIKTKSPDATAKASVSDEGYYTLNLSKKINVEKNDTVTVLYLVKSEGSYHVFSEYADPDFEMTVTESKPGQSYTYANGELKQPKGNYTGTIIGKAENKEPVAPVTEITETTTVTEAVTEPETVIATEVIETTTEEESLVIIPVETETETVLTEITSEEENETEQTTTQIPETTDTESTSNFSFKKVFITILIIAGVIVLLFIILVLALIAASKKKKV